MQLDYGDSWLNFESPLNGGSLQSSLAQNNPDPLDAGDPNQLVNRGTFYAKIQSATVESGGDEELIVRQSGEVSFWRLRQEFQLELTMRRGSARLEYRMEMMPRGKHYRVRAAFPTTLVTGIRRDEIPFGIQEGRTGEQVAQNWFDWSDAQGGLAVVNRGTPGANVDTSSGEGAVLLLTLFRSAAMEYKCESTGSFNEGVPHVFEYAVVPHTGNYSSVIREGMRFNHRPVACGEVENQAWAVAPEHVFVSGMRPRHEGVFLRLYEGTGKEAAVSLKVPDRFSRWCRADGLENPVEGWREISGRVELQLRGWEVAGILLR
jgi:alpha-mannosidase